jgi:hypothetical protein
VIGAHAMATPENESIHSRWTLRANVELAPSLLTEGALRLEPVVTDRRPAARAAAFESLVTHPEEQPGVLLDWRGE